MDKTIIRNRLVTFLTFIFILLAFFGFAIENSMMFVVCTVLALLFSIRLIILFIMHLKTSKKSGNKVKELRDKKEKTGFETLYLAVLDKNYSLYFSDDIKLNIIDLNKIEVKFYYKNVSINFIVEPNLLTYENERDIIMSSTINDISSEINNKISKIKKEIDYNINNSFDLFNTKLTNKRLDNLKKHVKFLNKNIYISSFVIFLFIIFAACFILDIKDKTENVLLEIIIVSITFCFVVILMICQIIYSLKITLRYKKMLKDIKMSNIREVSTYSKKVKLIYFKNKKNKIFVSSLKLYTNDGVFLIPVLDSLVFKSLKNKKTLYEDINNIKHNFKHYENSKIVITNNNIYEDLIIKHLKEN